MKSLHIITPVKDSIDLTLKTAAAVLDSKLNVPFTYTIYNDFSTPENTARLEEASRQMGFELVNLADITTTPSPNYLLVLRTTRRRALDADAGLLIVESDVVVRPDTLQGLFDGAMERPDCGIAASVTVDGDGAVNYPYGFAKDVLGRVEKTKKHCSFCCSLLTPALLRAFDFDLLNPENNWFDVTLSHESVKCGFANYLFGTLPVLHCPHSSRPWKQLKYTNPIKYYWKKFTCGLDKI